MLDTASLEDCISTDLRPLKNARGSERPSRDKNNTRRLIRVWARQWVATYCTLVSLIPKAPSAVCYGCDSGEWSTAHSKITRLPTKMTIQRYLLPSKGVGGRIEMSVSGLSRGNVSKPARSEWRDLEIRSDLFASGSTRTTMIAVVMTRCWYILHSIYQAQGRLQDTYSSFKLTV